MISKVKPKTKMRADNAAIHCNGSKTILRSILLCWEEFEGQGIMGADFPAPESVSQQPPTAENSLALIYYN